MNLKEIEEMYPYRKDQYVIYNTTIIKEEEMILIKGKTSEFANENKYKHYTVDKEGKHTEVKLEQLKEVINANLLNEQDNKIKPKEEEFAQKDINTLNLNNEEPENSTKTKEHNNNSENNITDDQVKMAGEYIGKTGGIGSNNCIISGKYTKTGKPYLCNDPHLNNHMPSFWYLINAKIGNEYHLTGATVPGLPTLLSGTNGHLVYGITSGMVDSSDIYKFKKTQNGQSITLGKHKTMKVIKRTEKIYLNLQRTEFKEMDFYETEIGPVINNNLDTLMALLGIKFNTDKFKDEKDYFYVLRSTYSDKDQNTLSTCMDLTLSKNYEEFRHSLSRISVILNIVFADVK